MKRTKDGVLLVHDAGGNLVGHVECVHLLQAEVQLAVKRLVQAAATLERTRAGDTQ